MIDSATGRDPVELLAEEFAARCRKGEAPSIFEYTSSYPQYAEQIEQLFPTVAMMEQLRLDEDDCRESANRKSGAFDAPEQLGDFRILREIGRGGMGIVYEAEQRSLGRRVALKILPEHGLHSDRRLQRFRREARTAARLRHTGVVSVFGVGENEGLHYYVMPLIHGVGLDEIIAKLRSEACRPARPPGRRAKEDHDFGPLLQALIERKFPGASSATPARRSEMRGRPVVDRCVLAARVGLQAAEALYYAHEQGTLHRDIKPGNVLVDCHGNACLADFGLARAIEPSPIECEAGRPRQSEVVGTPRYMAPEQLRGDADPRSDIYALGLTLYELITLTPAVRRPPDAPPGRRGLGTLPAAPRQIDRAIPRDLEAIVLKCVADEPAKRYPTAGGLADDLRRFLADKPVRARRVSTFERACRWCRRNPALASASATAALFVVAFTTTALVGHFQTKAAYSETRRALARAEATSGVALQVLEDLYLQLSPERVWIASDSDPAGEACACVGLRSARPAAGDQRAYTQVQPSEQTASLLENLLVFYDRLADQISDDRRVMLESAIASRRVGDIRQRLGQINQAEREYRKAVDKLTALSELETADARIRVELARCQNEIGNLYSAGLQATQACDAHHRALDALHAVASLPNAPEECRYELARTYFFLASREPERSSSGPAGAAAHAGCPAKQATLLIDPAEGYRRRAIELLEELVACNTEAPDYRFLLALCYRPMALVPGAATDAATRSGQRRALKILQALKREYPQVADYRCELAATYAWVHVGLFPWQGPSVALMKTEASLHKALKEAQWLVDNNPTIPQYVRSKALILAKLGAVCAEAGRRAEAARWFGQAVRVQSQLIENRPDLPLHDRALREFFRYRMADSRIDPAESAELSELCELLRDCAGKLRSLCAEPELADDRLARSALKLTEEALDRLQQR